VLTNIYQRIYAASEEIQVGGLSREDVGGRVGHHWRAADVHAEEVPDEGVLRGDDGGLHVTDRLAVDLLRAGPVKEKQLRQEKRAPLDDPDESNWFLDLNKKI